MKVLHEFTAYDGTRYRIVHYDELDRDYVTTFYNTYDHLMRKWHERDHTLNDFAEELVNVLKIQNEKKSTPKPEKKSSPFKAMGQGHIE